MKIFKKFGILVLMLLLLGGAFVLPKFVQRASTEDMVPTFVKEDQKIAAEKAAAQAAQVAPAEPVIGAIEKVPELTLASSEVLSFFDLIQEENLSGATKMLAEMSEQLPDSLKNDLADRLAKAQTLAQNEAKTQIAEAKKQAARVAELEKSVTELAKTNELAENYAAETEKLREELEAVKKEQKEKANNPAPTPVSAVPEPLSPDTIPEVVTIGFDSDSSVLKEADHAALRPGIEALQAEPRLAVQLRGYADSRGDSAYNGILALARAEVVKDFLVESGIPSNRIAVVSFGETQAGAEDSGSVQRRVEVRFREQ